ncbi:hypothetical protein VV93_v1c37800 [Vibrio vulnificus]|uniref:hypothetical protein n=1 Tax=Vibrio vulnificus TaxID=672 RepID=UPI0004F5EC11|nr:hypothetical protein [Vibrio vulnificus]AIL70645.1 hypothetical protein VV93_v1c15550 [Vibrio vulnificus]AIL72836.1 hypothetical protein VV93_v1c37800 [Vibrio vulnificus]PWY26811.1 hypothetical protein VV97_23215 [Vibrio vulnificus]
MESIVISAENLSALIEAAYFNNFLAVVGGLFVYDLLSFSFSTFMSFLRNRKEQVNESTTH